MRNHRFPLQHRGVNGIKECIDFMGMSILNKDGQDFCKKVLQAINKNNDKADAKYKYAHNLEQTPRQLGNSDINL